MSQESPGCLGWTIRVIAMILILIGGLFLWSTQPVETAGNTGIWFLSDLGTHPRADPREAYDRLCAAEKARLDKGRFLEREFGEYSALAARGAAGAAKQYPELETLDRNIQTAWVEYEVQDGDTIETWRLNLVRERKWWDWKGDWKICGIESGTNDLQTHSGPHQGEAGPIRNRFPSNRRQHERRLGSTCANQPIPSGIALDVTPPGPRHLASACVVVSADEFLGRGPDRLRTQRGVESHPRECRGS